MRVAWTLVVHGQCRTSNLATPQAVSAGSAADCGPPIHITKICRGRQTSTVPLRIDPLQRGCARKKLITASPQTNAVGSRHGTAYCVAYGFSVLPGMQCPRALANGPSLKVSYA